MGKLIVFEGIDGSGKSTQFRLMCRCFEQEGVAFSRLTFPQYQEPSSALIRMYLNGEFGEDPEAVNPYAASTFFAVDRYASYMKVWREPYNSGTVILTDRYTTSNALHQGAKLSEKKRHEFFRWLYEFEFGLMELPKPHIVIYMDIPAGKAAERIRDRQAATGTAADIHERNMAYLTECARCGEQAADYFGWHKVSCFKGGTARSEQEIHDEIRNIIGKME